MKKNKILIASDHAGRSEKLRVLKVLYQLELPFEDLSPKNVKTDDYPDFAEKVGKQVVGYKDTIGILLCGTGIGISIAANKIKGVRAALCHSKKQAKLARKDNNANVLVLPGKYSDVKANDVKGIIKAFYSTKFESGRHKRRINKISKLERK